jgi:hypothetical protein
LFGVWFNRYRASVTAMTVEEYLERRRKGYEKLRGYRYGFVGDVLSGLVLFGGCIGVYELVALTVHSLFAGR